MSTESDADFLSADDDENGWDDSDMELIYDNEENTTANPRSPALPTKVIKPREEMISILVNGYIRQAQQLLKNMTIPTVIVDQCIAFYYFKIFWNLNSSQIPSDSRITVINQCITPKLCNIFEMEVIVNNVGNDNVFDIGYIDAKKDGKIGRSFGLSKYITVKGDKIHEGRAWYSCIYSSFKSGDKIRITIDFVERKCSWYVNNELLTYFWTYAEYGAYPAIYGDWKNAGVEITNYRLLSKYGYSYSPSEYQFQLAV